MKRHGCEDELGCYRAEQEAFGAQNQDQNHARGVCWCLCVCVSCERTMAKDCRNALVAAYTATVGPGPTEERDPMNRMRPPV